MYIRSWNIEDQHVNVVFSVKIARKKYTPAMLKKLSPQLEGSQMCQWKILAFLADQVGDQRERAIGDAFQHFSWNQVYNWVHHL